MPRPVRPLALAAGLLGAMGWVANLWVGAAALSLAGSLLLAVAAGLVGTGLARLPWLAVVSGVGAVALCWSLVELARDLGPVPVVEAVLGAGAALVVGVVLVVRTPPAPERGNHRG